MSTIGRQCTIFAALSPYSQVIRAGCPLYLSSQLGYASSSQAVASEQVQKQGLKQAQQLGSKKPPISQKVKFVDQLRIVARGGQGGGGSSALFGRTGHHPRAAGGSGAPGGSVVLRATTQLTGLGSIPLHVEAERGGPGGKQWMDGKRGADKVLKVPPGTMVWRLVQLRGAEADTPHGVTPVPGAAQHSTAQHTLQQQEPQGQQQAVLSGVGTTTSMQGTPLGSSSTSTSTSSRPQHRKLFSGDQLQPEPLSAAPPVDHTDSSAPTGYAASNSSTGSSSTSHDPHTEAGLQTLHHTDSYEQQDSSASLYDDLLQCRHLLSNKEKLQLLHYGSLGAPAVSSMVTEWDDSSEADDLQDDSDSSGDTDSELTDDDEEEYWEVQQQQQQHAAGSDWRGLGEHGDTDMRQFDKQQVWSILLAQAELLGVLECEGQEMVVAQGGRGGRGNAMAPSNHQRPASKVRSDGKIGQEVLLFLQLRLMADVALVGLPNVGKSSLIAALTGARAQVGSYAFTTLRPQLGALLPTVPDASVTAASDLQHMQQPLTAISADAAAVGSHGSALAAAAVAAAGDEDRGLTGHRLVLADLPGLVPGAHAGKGRGMDFLKHLQKARCIAVVIDMTGQPAHSSSDEASGASPEGQVGQVSSESSSVSQDQPEAGGWEALVPYSPEQQLNILLDELRCYDAKTLSQPMLIVANKVDSMSAQAVSAALQRLKASTSLPIVPVSAQQHLGLSRLAQSLQLLAGGT